MSADDSRPAPPAHEPDPLLPPPDPVPDEQMDLALTYPYVIPTGSFVVDVADGSWTPADDLDVVRAVGGREPALAIGSNGAPAQLARKLGAVASDAGGEVIVSQAEVADHDVVYAARVAPYGAIPATLTPSAGTCASVKLVWLTDAQQRAVDATESLGSGYRLRHLPVAELDGTAAASALAQMTHLPVYEAVAGPLQHRGAPVPIAEVPAARRRWPALRQPEVHALVARRLGLGSADLVHTALTDRTRWAALNAHLAADPSTTAPRA